VVKYANQKYFLVLYSVCLVFVLVGFSFLLGLFTSLIIFSPRQRNTEQMMMMMMMMTIMMMMKGNKMSCHSF